MAALSPVFVQCFRTLCSIYLVANSDQYLALTSTFLLFGESLLEVRFSDCTVHFMVVLLIGQSRSVGRFSRFTRRLTACVGQCQQWFCTVTSCLGPGSNRTVAKLAVRVVNTPEPSTWVQFNGHFPTHLTWAGCQRVHPQIQIKLWSLQFDNSVFSKSRIQRLLVCVCMF